MKSVKTIIKEIENELKIGTVKIPANPDGDWTFYSKMKLSKTMLNDANFVSACENYLNIAKDFYEEDKVKFDLTLDGYYKKIILFLLFNMSNYDYNNPIAYVNERTQMLKNKFALESEISIGEFEHCKIQLTTTKNPINMESPMFAAIKFIDADNNSFTLPKVGYGITDKMVKIYYVQAQKGKQDNTLAKKFDRLFRKVNKGIDLHDDIYEISPNALVSLTIFLKYIKELGINDVVAENFLPERYEANKLSGYRKAKNKVEAQEFLVKHMKNQYNMTNKLMNLCLRYAHHFGVKCDYDNNTQQMLLNTQNMIDFGDNLIYEINSYIKVDSKNSELEV